MPLLTLESRGLIFAYEDSGAPANSTTYTTVFLVHPPWFNARIFRPLFPYAAKHNLRFIAPHAREYCGSSPYTEDELEQCHSSSPADQDAIICSTALDLARFIAQSILCGDLPPPCERNGVKSGGIGLFGWSGGCAQILSLLANITTMDEALSTLLERYLGTVILHDCPSMCYGIPEPTTMYHPFRDPSLSNEQREAHMMTFIVSYYEPIKDLASVTPMSLKQRRAMAEISTKLLPQEVEEIACPDVARRFGLDLLEWQVYAETPAERFSTLKEHGRR
ncbi:hypothetical protein BC835DRAFT_1411942 [Cytidiella melzeri]|nr:hypothetical protein BC835DRAFT_1411942 [Cytidiella melzeri]